MAYPEAPPARHYDADRLLAGYRTARAQEALFDLRQGPGVGYDEFVVPDWNFGTSQHEVADNVARLKTEVLDQL